MSRTRAPKRPLTRTEKRQIERIEAQQRKAFTLAVETMGLGAESVSISWRDCHPRFTVDPAALAESPPEG